ncbi:MAG: hypothetical protein ACTSXD_08545 [Candidatus Heimdallarchaeaceae archaeon]
MVRLLSYDPNETTSYEGWIGEKYAWCSICKSYLRKDQTRYLYSVRGTEVCNKCNHEIIKEF